MKDYKKILKGVVDIINTTEKSDIGFANICTYIGENCPELAESEDEKIRGKIIATIHLYYGEPLEDEAKEMIAWLEKRCKNNMGISEATKQKLGDNLNKALEKETPESWNEFLEKQGEQKPYGQRQECVDCQFNYAGECKGSCAKKRGEQKLNVNDNAKEMFIKALERVEEQNAKGYKLTDCDKNSWWEDFKNYTSCTIEQKPADKYEPMSLDEAIKHCKEKSCGNNACALEHKQLGKWLTELKKLKERKPTEWSEIDKANLEDSIYFVKEFRRSNLCNNESRLQNSITCIEWLASLKDRVLPQPKQEWSEEDESHIRYLIECLEYCKKGVALTMTTSTSQEYINWLKSLRPQNTWKPSDEQMVNLEYYMHTLICNSHKETLFSLYQDLKKLREK